MAIRERIARVQRQRHVEEISARAQDMIRQFGGAAPYIDTENLSKHGLDFADAPAVFQSPQLTWLDTREDYGEDRWCSLGMLQGRVVVLVYTERVSDMVRILSLRKATRYERTQYD